VKLQFDVTCIIRICDIILQMEMDNECFGTEFSEVKEQFEVTCSIRNGKKF